MKTKPKPQVLPCPRCKHNNDIIASILKHLDIERHATGELVMWPDTDMRWHAITCAISGLINREREITEIESVLLDVGVRPEGQIVDGVKRLVDKYWAEVTKNSESSRKVNETPAQSP